MTFSFSQIRSAVFMSQFRVVPMAEGHLDQVVDVHVKAFATTRSTRLGRRFVRRMYKWFLLNCPQWSIIALDGEQVVGVFVSSENDYTAKLFVYVLPEIAWAILTQPSMWFNRKTYFESGLFLRAVWNRLLRREAKIIDEVPTVYGGSVGVLPSARGAGLPLMLALDRLAWSNGMERIKASVETKNVKMCEIYTRLGYQLEERGEVVTRFIKSRPSHIR